jgi:flagellar protein FlbD
MIQLTRLNNSAITINSDLIKSAEASPDTVITLLNGEKIIVLETVSELVTRVVEFRRRVLAGVTIWPPSVAIEKKLPVECGREL